MRYGNVLLRRLGKLEAIRNWVEETEVFRVVLRANGRKLDLETQFVQRTVNGNSTITELVTLEDSRNDICDEELDRIWATAGDSFGAHDASRSSGQKSRGASRPQVYLYPQ